MHSRPLRLAMQLGLFQLSLGILGVLILGLLNRLLIQDIQVPAALVAVALDGQQLMGFTRAWFGYRSDRIPPQPAAVHALHRQQHCGDCSVVRCGLPVGAALGHQHGGLWR